jgi:hypothetical protein
LAAVASGAAIAVIKGQDVGFRDALGNMSAPWVLVPFIAGTRARGLWRGSLLGLAVTLFALLGFYAAEAAVLDLGPHPWWVDLQLTLKWNVYDSWGIVSGLLYGSLGALWSARRSLVAGMAVGVAFVGEPMIAFLLAHVGIWDAELLHYTWLWGAELIAGAVAVAYALTLRQPRTPHDLEQLKPSVRKAEAVELRLRFRK